MSTIFADGAVISAAPPARPLRRRAFAGRPVAAVGGLAWVVIIAGHLVGLGRYLDHDAMLKGGTPSVGGLGLFLAAWLVMVAAMMLPATPPVRAATGPFLAGFAAAWAVAGYGLLGFDLAVHQVMDDLPVLAARPWLVPVALLGATGLVQLARSARRDVSTLIPSYPASPFRTGLDQGLRCLHADGPLMLVMFAAAGDLAWMAVLTLVMAGERLPCAGRYVTAFTGVALLVAAALAVLGSYPA